MCYGFESKNMSTSIWVKKATRGAEQKSVTPSVSGLTVNRRKETHCAHCAFTKHFINQKTG